MESFSARNVPGVFEAQQEDNVVGVNKGESNGRPGQRENMVDKIMEGFIHYCKVLGLFSK